MSESVRIKVEPVDEEWVCKVECEPDLAPELLHAPDAARSLTGTSACGKASKEERSGNKAEGSVRSSLHQGRALEFEVEIEPVWIKQEKVEEEGEGRGEREELPSEPCMERVVKVELKSEPVEPHDDDGLEVSGPSAEKCPGEGPRCSETRPEQLKTCSSGMQYKCEICKKKFKHESQLITHGRVHTGEKPYACDICDKAFLQKNHLATHQKYHTTGEPYVCDVCNKQFTKRKVLVQHSHIHSGKKPYKCDMCDKQFLQKNNLTAHKRVHTGERRHGCDICHRQFSHKSNLTAHKRVHTGEKPYTCDICNKQFTHKSYLLTHQLIHTGEKPYACDICNKQFAQKNNISRHRLTHTEGKPHACDVCNKHFTRRTYLNRHRHKKHGTQIAKTDSDSAS